MTFYCGTKQLFTITYSSVKVRLTFSHLIEASKERKSALLKFEISFKLIGVKEIKRPFSAG
jgi:hypothetical protein